MNKHHTPLIIRLPHIQVPVAELISAYEVLKHRSNDEQFYLYADTIKGNIGDKFPFRTNQYGYVSITDIADELRDKWTKSSATQMYKMVARGQAPALDDRNYTQIKDDVPDSVRNFLTQFRGTVSRTRFALLSAYSTIKEHNDNDINHTIRIHIPLITDKYNIFSIKNSQGENEYFNLEIGNAYFINTSMSHFVINGSEIDRLHLIVNLNSHEDLKDLLNENISVF